MIPIVLCSECLFPFSSDSWENRHDPELDVVHESCCPKWDCSKAPDVWTPGRILEAFERGWVVPSDWQARLWRAGYVIGGQRRRVA